MLPDIQPGNTKILYFFNCLLDGMHTKFIEFCDFVLRNFDHRNFGLLFPKFLFYWAKWSVQHNGTKSINFLVILLYNSSGNPTTTLLSGVSLPAATQDMCYTR